MSIFSDEDRQLTAERATANIATAKPTGFTENMRATWDEFRNNDDYGALRAQRREAWDARIKSVQELTGEKVDTPWSKFGEDSLVGGLLADPQNRYDPDDPGSIYTLPDPLAMLGRMFDGVDNDLTEPQRLREHEARLDAIRESLPPEQRKMIPTRDEIEKRLQEKAKRLEGVSQDIGGRATVGGMVGGFVGASGAAIIQPEVLVTLPIGAPVRAGILARVLMEAGIGAGTEALLQPGVQAQRDELGLESGIGKAAENVATAGIGAAGLTGAAIGVGAALKLISKGGVKAFEKSIGRTATAEEKALVHQYQRDSDIEAQSPYEEKTAAAYRVQQQNEQAGYEAALAGRELGESEIVKDPILTPRAMDMEGHSITMLRNSNLDQIGVDADLMQFKTGGDAAGVTDRLQGVTEWVPERAGVSLIYEFSDGTRIVADGHQRLGLAKRLAAEGQDIELPALVLRELDGVTPAEARARAAFKNIAEGTGSAQDAAKVLRDMGVTPAEMGLPPRSALVRDAEGLAALDDETFGLVINRVLSEQFGAIVGRLVEDPRLQPEIARLLVKLKPANAAEADSIVRQAREAGSVSETQTSLFGDAEVTQSLYLEKARVLDRAMKMIRRNIDTFRTLDQRGSDIAAEGNILNEASNARRLEVEQTIKEYLQKQAHRKGFIGDALTEAARKAQSSGQYASPAREFVEAITRGINEGKIDGDALSGNRLDPESERADSEAVEAGDFEQVDDATISMFDEPNGAAAEDQAVAISREIVDEANARIERVQQASATPATESDLASIRQRSPLGRVEKRKIDKAFNQFEIDDEARQLIDQAAVPANRAMVVYRGRDGDPAMIARTGRSNSSSVDLAVAEAFGGKGTPHEAIAKITITPGTRIYSPDSGIRGGELVFASDTLYDVGARNADGLYEITARPQQVEAGADGKPQTLIDGVRPVSDADRMKLKADAPMRGGRTEVGGLFGDSMDQADLMDFAVPMGERIDADGNRVAQTQTIREAMAELEADQEFFEQLKLCDGGGR